MTRLLAAVVVLATPVLAAAQPRLVPPRLVPERDVQVLYRVSGPAVAAIPGGAPGGIRLEWDAAGERLRSGPVGGPVYAIADLGRHVADVVFTAQNTYLELPIRSGNPQALLSLAVAGADGQFTRGGTDRLLGLSCTEWTVRARKLDATACVTEEGVVLRASGTWNGQAGELVALSVSHGSVPPGQFNPPEGFARINLKGGQ